MFVSWPVPHMGADTQWSFIPIWNPSSCVCSYLSGSAFFIGNRVPYLLGETLMSIVRGIALSHVDLKCK